MQLTAEQVKFQQQYSFPHCDQRVLHAPGECEYCDHYPQWQQLRVNWGIAFSGSEQSIRLLANPDVKPCIRPYPHMCEEDGPCNGWPRTWPVLPCPADASRPPGAKNDHRRWGGNKPTSAIGDANWPAESAASVLMYGDKGGREPWPEWSGIRGVIARIRAKLAKSGHA